MSQDSTSSSECCNKSCGGLADLARRAHAAGAPEQLQVMMEGESLFNDATAIVLFQGAGPRGYSVRIRVGQDIVGYNWAASLVQQLRQCRSQKGHACPLHA